MADADDEQVCKTTDGSGTEGDVGSGGDEDGSPGADSDHADVFELLGNETRLAIVRELAGPRRTNWQLSGMAFAELRRAVGVRDAGNFSYHLDKLVGNFVFERDGEYVLTNRGLEVTGALEAGTYVAPGEPRDAELDETCPYPDCDRPLEAVYTDQYLRVHCPDHHIFEGEQIPPGMADQRTIDELVRMATLQRRQKLQLATEGVCRHCWGTMDATVPANEPSGPSYIGRVDTEDAVFARFTCRDCEFTWTLPAGICVVNHPAVLALYHEHGRDLRWKLAVELPFAGLEHPVVESTDPVRVRIDVTVADDVLALWLDENANVVEYERR